MDICHTIVAVYLADILIPFLKRTQVELLVLLYKRIHNIDLPPHPELSRYPLICGEAVLIIAQEGLYRLASGRKLIYYTHIKISVDRHGECAWYRGCRHHEHMRRNHILVPQTRTLSHTEAMLLINDNISEIAESDTVLDHCMGADKNMERPIKQLGIDLFTHFLSRRACEQFHIHPHGSDKCLNGLEMLGGKDLGRSHQTSLITVVKSYEHCEQCHKGLAATHIPLQKPVHLTPCSHIGAYLLYNPLLSTCEREREKLAIKIIEELPDTRKTETLGGG